MIDLKKLIDFLPFEYKDQDTYKVDGKGILERFLEICGSYFQDNIQSAGSDNGLSANYRTAIIHVIVSKKIASSGTEFGAFVTALFDENGEFVKTPFNLCNFQR